MKTTNNTEYTITILTLITGERGNASAQYPIGTVLVNHRTTTSRQSALSDFSAAVSGQYDTAAEYVCKAYIQRFVNGVNKGYLRKPVERDHEVEPGRMVA